MSAIASSSTVPRPLRLGILGAGGLGKGMAQLAQYRPDFQLVALADSRGYCVDPQGICVDTLLPLPTVAHYQRDTVTGVPTENAIIDMLKAHASDIDVLFWALPNLPVEFFATTLTHVLDETKFRGVCVDALKRTKAVENLMPLAPRLTQENMLYITGAGATPGFLTTLATVAAHSFVEVLSVDIHFGVGIACWDQYKATIREDLLHVPGFTADSVAAMSDAEIEAELAKRNGLLELHNMEHADDIILELAGICPRERVTVGGLVDTQRAQKPVSTTVTITGKTFRGTVGSHKVVLSDETTMVDNVCGPALGFLLRGWEQAQSGRAGLVTSADIMPRFASTPVTHLNLPSPMTQDTTPATV